MSSIFYQVIFEGVKEDSSDSYSLTFKDIFSDNQIQISSQFFTTLRVSSQKESNVVHFQNIKEVIKIGNPSSKIEINYYIAILYTNLNDGKKEGFLVGNVKNMGSSAFQFLHLIFVFLMRLLRWQTYRIFLNPNL